MPEIVRFYGIIIKMFFKPKEHEPSYKNFRRCGMNRKFINYRHYDTKN